MAMFVRTAGAVTGLLVFAVVMLGDTLRLRSGQTIQGTFLGGDARQIRFLGPDGVRTYSISDVVAVEFGEATATTAAPAARPATAARETTSSAGGRTGKITIPAGTRISVRTIDNIDVRATAAGEVFRASIDDPVAVDGQVVIPRGTDCTIQVVSAETRGAVSGSDEVVLKLRDITLNGKRYEVASEYAELKTRGQGARTARNAAVVGGIGAVIGGIAGGGKGAAIGATAGAGAGAAGSILRGPRLEIPPESVLTFELRQPLVID